MAALGHDLRISTLTRAYAAGALTPRDVLAEVARRVAACPRRGVWISLLDAAAVDAQLQDVERRRKKWGPAAVPLAGVPFAVKDNIDVAGVQTTAACPAYAYLPAQSATVVRRLTDAGAIVVGKTNLDQFATGLVGTRSPYGACENAFDPAYIAGGSSSGSAVAVAAGLVSFSLGTDTAGSGRVPAAFNSVVGLKPTRGRISAAGVVPACRSLDCVSIFTNDCADAELLLRVAAGDEDADPLSRPVPPASAAPKELSDIRCGVPRPEQLEFFGDRGAATLFAAAVDRARAVGVEIVQIDFSPFREAAKLLYDGPWLAERLEAAGTLLRECPDAVRPELRAILKDADRFSAADVFRAQRTLAGLRRAAANEWGRMEVLLLPTAGTIYRIAEVEADPLRLNRNLGHYTNFVNLMDLCGVAVPAGFLPAGVPMGVTFLAPAFEESVVLRIGAAFHARLLAERRT
jgi:allophanate hydrolase